MVVCIPVESDVVFSSIRSSDDKGVTIAYLQGRPWELTVHCHHFYSFAQPLHQRWLNLFPFRD